MHAMCLHVQFAAPVLDCNYARRLCTRVLVNEQGLRDSTAAIEDVCAPDCRQMMMGWRRVRWLRRRRAMQRDQTPARLLSSRSPLHADMLMACSFCMLRRRSLRRGVG